MSNKQIRKKCIENAILEKDLQKLIELGLIKKVIDPNTGKEGYTLNYSN